MKSATPAPLKAQDAFVVVRRKNLSWAIPAAAVARIVRADDATLPEPLPIPEEFIDRAEPADLMHALIVRFRGSERAILLGGRLDLVPAEGLSIQPLPALCHSSTIETLSLNAVALSEDEVRFLIVTPAS